MTELASQVRLRAGDRCEYCRIPQRAFTQPFHVEHIVARQHGGPTTEANLALACARCNLKKGPNLTGLDPVTGAITRLFHPRADVWEQHFSWGLETLMPTGIAIHGRTAEGRATVAVLDLNNEMRQMLRYELRADGLMEGLPRVS
ncbi:MAG: HNH endonuclease signature motif containing protein [Acidobacteria bacterium]|nr:HNH endonuclease signature motif containing protein [Acidobacteriota bacterium]